MAGLAFGLAFGLAGGATVGLVAGLVAGLAGLRVTVGLAGRFSLAEQPTSVMRQNLAFGLVVGLAAGLAVGLAGGLAGGLAFGLAGGLAGGPVFGMTAGLAIWVRYVIGCWLARRKGCYRGGSASSSTGPTAQTCCACQGQPYSSGIANSKPGS